MIRVRVGTMRCRCQSSCRRSRFSQLGTQILGKSSFSISFRICCASCRAFMSQEKYIGMDVHQATISVAVMDGRGKLIMECVLETKASTVVQFIQGLQGT